MITFEQFKQVEMKVALVKSVEAHPNADRLMILKIDVGGEERQIVAGLRQWYTPEQLVGKKIIVVTNLEPKLMRGVESNGMLLAAQAGDSVVVLTVERDLPAGAVVS